MNFTLSDAAMLLGAVATTGLLVVFSGYFLARATASARTTKVTSMLDGLVVGLAVLPAIDSIAARLGSLDLASALNVLLAVAGLVLLIRSRPTLTAPLLATVLIVAWGILVMVEWVDFDIAGKLYQPLTIFDLVKHAATTQALYDSGAPPRDAFFLRPERASYYYFFYTPAAVAMRLSGGLVDAKAAVGGLVFWVGLGAYGLVRLALAECGIVLRIAPRRQPLLIVAVLAAGGLDILAVTVFAVTRHYWIADPLQWNIDQVGAWFEDIIWVPHHVSGLIAGAVGIFALARIAGASPATRRPIADDGPAVVLAGVCFAAMLGLSIWVALGFVFAVGVWAVLLLVERRWTMIAGIAAAGLIALVLSVPQLYDLRAGRAPGGPFPIALAVRFFTPVDLFVPTVARPLADALTLPFNYAFEFGVLALGSIVFYRLRRAGGDGLGGGEAMRALVVTAATGLFFAAILRSTLFNNDLGWRILLAPLLAGTIWTIAAFDRLLAAGARAILSRIERPLIFGALVCGWATVIYTAGAMRLYPFFTVNPSARFMAADPATQRGLRAAFEWANTHLAASAVLQQNPMKKRAFAFGVYGRNPTGVADAYGSLYGAAATAVAARRAELGPIFEGDLSSSDAAARAAAAGIADLVVTASDPVWAHADSFVWHAKPVYTSATVRIIPIVTLEAAR